MAGSLRVRDGASCRFRGSEQSAKGRRLRSGKMERVRFRPGDGSAGHDPVRHSRYQDVRPERPAVPEAICMTGTVRDLTGVSSRGWRSAPRDLAPKFAANAKGKCFTIDLRGSLSGRKEVNQPLRGP